MREVRWILQENLIKESVLLEIKQALKDDDVSIEGVKVIPFSNELPDIK